jgi:RNA polymerase sigma-70 factor (ECF subfamily)
MISEHDAPLSGLSDQALLRAIAARDTSGFRVLVERYGKVPHRIAVRMLGNPADAEDIAQEALLRLWRLTDRATEITSVEAWLRRVTTNLCLDRLRQRLRRAETDAENFDAIDGAPLPDAVIEDGQQMSIAKRAIARLHDRQRAAIVLTYYEGLSNAVAANALDMNIKAFESLLARARTALREDLAAALERTAP